MMYVELNTGGFYEFIRNFDNPKTASSFVDNYVQGNGQLFNYSGSKIGSILSSKDFYVISTLYIANYACSIIVCVYK
jgi:hypothetical protein